MSVKRRRKGQSIIETIVGIIFLVPIVLFLFDVAVLVLASSANDNLAKSAARAAASATEPAAPYNGQGNKTVAKTAAEQICSNFAESTIIKRPGASFITGFHYHNPANTPTTADAEGTPEGADADCAVGQVCVVTTMDVKVPVPFAGFTGSNFRARAVEPIVSLSP